MEATVLDESFNAIYNIDVYESLIWTERYIGYGDFELYLPMDMAYLEFLKQDYYIRLHDSEMVMIIEDIEIVTNFEDGSHLKVTGRSLESLLDRRIVWKQTRFQNKNIQEAMKQLITENIIDPTIPERAIPNFVFEDVDWLDVEIPSDGETPQEVIDAITEYKNSLKISKEYMGDNLYDIMLEWCQVYDIGFRISIDYQTSSFIFKFYKGTDRSFSSNISDSRVVFSPSYDNLVNSNYLDSKSGYKNVTLVMGEEPEGEERIKVVVGSASSISRRELYTDARDLQRKQEDDSVLDLAPYRELLRKRGREKLAENTQIQSFEGEIEAFRGFVYGRDYFIGDIAQIENEWGIRAIIRITEIIRSQDKEGYSLYPTFRVMQ